MNKSPIPKALLISEVKYTFLVPQRPVVAEAVEIVTVSRVAPDDCLRIAESEARKTADALSTTVADVAPELKAALRLVEVEGLEVESVSETRVNALAFGVFKKNNNNATGSTIRKYFINIIRSKISMRRE